MFLALKHFVQFLQNHHVLVRSDNTTDALYKSPRGNTFCPALQSSTKTHCVWLEAFSFITSDSCLGNNESGADLICGESTVRRMDSPPSGSERGHSIIRIAPNWPGKLWLTEIIQLLPDRPWPLPLCRDLLSQAHKDIFHPLMDKVAL